MVSPGMSTDNLINMGKTLSVARVSHPRKGRLDLPGGPLKNAHSRTVNPSPGNPTAVKAGYFATKSS